MAGLQQQLSRLAAVAEADGIAGKVQRASELGDVGERSGVHRVLPVAPALQSLLPGRGLRRGHIIAVRARYPAELARYARPRPRCRETAARPVAEAAGRATEPAPGRATGVAAAGRRSGAWPAGRRVTGSATRLAATRLAATRLAATKLAVAPQPATHPYAGLVEGPVAGTSLLFALLAEASQAGSWCAVVGVPTLGAAAAAEFGIVLDRLALVPYPGPDWPRVVAALVDGVDVVVAAPPGPVAAHLASRLAARARQRGCVLVPLISGSGSPASPYGRWDGADITLEPVHGVWEGLGQGRGRLCCRRVTVAARGRGAAFRTRQAQVWLPAAPKGWVGGEPADSVQPAERPTLTLIQGGRADQLI